jgi:hypothetical protein
VACVAIEGTHDIDLTTAELEILGTVDGQVAAGGASRWWLVGVGGDEVELGDVLAGNQTLAVLPGRYAVYYGWISGNGLPRNSAARVGWLDLQAGIVEITLDLPTSRLTGAFTFDGIVAPDSAAENGAVFLRSGDDEIALGETRAGTFDVLVTPGAYDVEYRAITGSALAPANSAATVTKISVSPGTSDIDIDLQTAAVSGNFSIDGDTPPASKGASGRISLVSLFDSDTIVLGQTHHGVYQTRMLAGSYEIIYEVTGPGAGVPDNTRAVLGEAYVDPGALVLDIDVPTTALAGAFTLAGVAGDAATTGDAALFLTNVRGDVVPLGNLASGAYTATAVPGSYSIIYTNLEPGGAELPINTSAVLGTVDIPVGGEVALDIDVPVIELTGGITIDGLAPPVMGDGGRILLDDAGTGAPFVIADTGDATFMATVVPGDYDIRYAAEPPTIVAPTNGDVVIASVSLTETSAIDLDVPVADTSGAITIDGAAVPASIDAELRHTDAGVPGSTGLVTSVADGSYTGRLVPMRYVVRYAAIDADARPANRDAPVACVDLSE